MNETKGTTRRRPRPKDRHQDRTAQKALNLLARHFPDLTGEQAAAVARTLTQWADYDASQEAK